MHLTFQPSLPSFPSQPTQPPHPFFLLLAIYTHIQLSPLHHPHDGSTEATGRFHRRLQTRREGPGEAVIIQASHCILLIEAVFVTHTTRQQRGGAKDISQARRHRFKCPAHPHQFHAKRRDQRRLEKAAVEEITRNESIVPVNSLCYMNQSRYILYKSISDRTLICTKQK